MFELEIQARSGSARAGILPTPHGDVPTPMFMPVGTRASVKSLSVADLHTIGAKLILANTYHLYLRPGATTIRRAGGVARFSGWNGPTLTDSGGFQVVSLADLARVDDDGVTFRSHLDGSLHRFTPESVVNVQRSLGPDFMMTLDVPPRPADSVAESERANRLTQTWAERALREFRRTEGTSSTGKEQCLFGIAQGGFDARRRREAASALVSLGFPGYAAGGIVTRRRKGADPRDAGLHAGKPSAGPAALSHGNGNAGGSRRSDGARRGPLRLRLAHAQRSQWAGVHAEGNGESPFGNVMRKISIPWIHSAAARRAPVTRGPICATC